MRATVQGALSVVDGAGTTRPVQGLEGLFVDFPDPVTVQGVTKYGGIYGPWTPVLGGVGGESGQAYSYQTGHCVLYDRELRLWAYTQFSAKGTINGQLCLKGFTIPSLNAPGFFAGSVAYWSNMSPEANDVTDVKIYAGGHQSQALLVGFRAGQNPRPLTTADINDHTQFIISLSYPIDPLPQ